MLGSSEEGWLHWWTVRLTSIALIPLSIWFVYSVAMLSSDCGIHIYDWIASPWTATFLIAFVIALFYHASLGMQVVFEDYVSHEALKLCCVIGTKFVAVLLTISSSVSILTVVFTHNIS